MYISILNSDSYYMFMYVTKSVMLPETDTSKCSMIQDKTFLFLRRIKSYCLITYMTWTYLLIVDKKITGDQLSLAFSFLIVYTWWLYLQFYLPRFVFLPSLCMPVEGEPVGGYSLVSPTERGPSGGGREPCRCPPPDPQGGGQSGGTKFETHRAKILQRKHWTFSVKRREFQFWFVFCLCDIHFHLSRDIQMHVPWTSVWRIYVNGSKRTCSNWTTAAGLYLQVFLIPTQMDSNK